MANDDEKRSPDDAEDERDAPEGEEDEQGSHDDEGDESESDESDDEGDEGEDEDEDEGDEPEAAAGAAAAAAAAAAKKKTGRKHKASGKISAGQRLAAAKAAKAAKKIAQRGKEAEVVEEQAVETATAASTWLDRNRNKLLGAFAAVLLLGGAFFGIRATQQKSAAEASQLLWEATEILNASIRAPGDEDAADADDADDEVTYETIAARADAALAKLDELFASHGDSPAAAWGRLEEGRARYQKGEHAAARTAFEAALAQGNEALAPRALEGIAFTYEAEENWTEAIARFEQLREEGGALQILADYHLARIHLARNEEDPAKTKLQAVLEALREEGAPELAYVRDQAELRLMAIDSSLVQRDAAGQMDPAEMQRLIEQLTRQQQQQGGAP